VPDVLIVCDGPPNTVEVPLEVVPWKYMVPSPPLEAFSVVLIQTVPPPVTLTVAGRGLTVIWTGVEMLFVHVPDDTILWYHVVAVSVPGV